MGIESSIVAAGNALVINPQPKSTQRGPEVKPIPEQKPEAAERSEIIIRQGDEKAYERADEYREAQQRTYREFSDGSSRDAIEAYQSLLVASKREEVSEMMGVDTYA